MSKLARVHARQILDSRGNPTIEVDVWSDQGHFARAAVPSGASTGSREALELRDGDKKCFLGKGVLKAVSNVNNILGPALTKARTFSLEDQTGLDKAMLEMDGTEYKSKLGANALLGISLAVARLGAEASKLSLYKYLRETLHCPNPHNKYVMPTPLMNIINGGAHASNNLDIQEFMIVPCMAKTFGENLRAGVEVFHSLKKVLDKAGHSTNVGDEGGFAPNLQSHEEAIESILKAIEAAGYRPGVDVCLAFDVAASEFFDEKTQTYPMQGKDFTTEAMIEYYSGLIKKYPIYSIEDGLAEGDQKGWTALNARLGNQVKLVGDDLFVTNKKILAHGIAEKQANAILVKVNQIGTLTETFETMDLAYQNGMVNIISHRSGETSDHFIADLAVATGAGHIKTGSASRSDRMEKYNQLLRIEEELGQAAVFKPVSLGNGR
ncbi:MAG: phosphopyruvate hydratase [Bdellovibrionales bacterium GWA2_49_15]|nr:MAG: phosphopyruvate hydratase [Bdellovibrionales bacterium GWA2_49_15]HAZ12657.1 phosphopyruvate hydratase [Bdellovibrionales bacterium]